jgi:hypothetical protein
MLDIRFTEFDVGGAAVHDGPDAFAVGLAEGGDAKNSAECAGHCSILCFSCVQAQEKWF